MINSWQRKHMSREARYKTSSADYEVEARFAKMYEGMPVHDCPHCKAPGAQEYRMTVGAYQCVKCREIGRGLA